MMDENTRCAEPSPADRERSWKLIRLSRVEELAQRMLIGEGAKQYPRSYSQIIWEAEMFVDAMDERRRAVDAEHELATKEGT